MKFYSYLSPPPPPPPPPENHNIQYIALLRNTGPGPLKISKLLSQHSMLGHHRHASETPFIWRADFDPVIVVFPSST